MKDSLNYYVKVKARDVYFWCPFFEAFEGMLALRTPEPARGQDDSILHIMVAPDFKDQFEELVKKHGLEPGNIPPA